MALRRETTTELMNESLRDAHTFPEFETQFRKRYTDNDLQEFIAQKIEEKGLSRAEIIRDADIDRTYGYQIFRGIRKPARAKLIQLAFGLKLNAEEAAEMFRLAGCAPLYPKIQDEAAILFCLYKGYTYTDCMLFVDALHRRGGGHG